MAKGGFVNYTGTQTNAIRGANNIGSDQGLVYMPPYVKVHGLGSARSAIGAATREYMSSEVDGFWLQNNAGAADLIGGVGLRIKKKHWIAGQWDNAGGSTQYIDDTIDAQDRDTADDFEFRGNADDDGIVIGSKIPWGWFTADIDTNNTGNATTLFEYWNDAGAWATPAATSVKMSEMVITTTTFGTGETSYVWDPAQDWGKTGEIYQGTLLATPEDGVTPDGYYYARFRIDNADVIDTTNMSMSAIEIGIHLLEENVDDENAISRGPNLNFYSPYCDAVVFINSLYGTGNIGYQVSARARG